MRKDKNFLQDGNGATGVGVGPHPIVWYALGPQEALNQRFNGLSVCVVEDE